MTTETDTTRTAPVKSIDWAKRIEFTLRHFDFERALRVMTHCGYTDKGEPLTLEGIKQTARKMLEEIAGEDDTLRYIMGHFTVMRLDDNLLLMLVPVHSDTIEAFD